MSPVCKPCYLFCFDVQTLGIVSILYLWVPRSSRPWCLRIVASLPGIVFLSKLGAGTETLASREAIPIASLSLAAVLRWEGFVVVFVLPRSSAIDNRAQFYLK